jgi:hypothetical protein
MQPADRQNAPGTPPRFRALYRSLGVNVVVPLVVAQWLLHQGRSPVFALSVAALFPLGDGIVSIVRRRIDLLGVMSFSAIVLGIALSLATGNAAFAIAKESLFTGAFGLGFLISLTLKRPLIFWFGRQFNADNPDAVAAWDANWERPGFRKVLRLMTLVWGVGLLTEAAARVAFALTLTPAVAIVVSPTIGIGSIALLVVWTTSYAAKARRRAQGNAIAPSR